MCRPPGTDCALGGGRERAIGTFWSGGVFVALCGGVTGECVAAQRRSARAVAPRRTAASLVLGLPWDPPPPGGAAQTTAHRCPRDVCEKVRSLSSAPQTVRPPRVGDGGRWRRGWGSRPPTENVARVPVLRGRSGRSVGTRAAGRFSRGRGRIDTAQIPHAVLGSARLWAAPPPAPGPAGERTRGWYCRSTTPGEGGGGGRGVGNCKRCASSEAKATRPPFLAQARAQAGRTCTRRLRARQRLPREAASVLRSPPLRRPQAGEGRVVHRKVPTRRVLNTSARSPRRMIPMCGAQADDTNAADWGIANEYR